MWAAKVDLKSAYNHLPICPEHRPWLCFQYQEKFYMHNAMPFGLSVAPREWQRLMQPILTHMRALGSQIWIYLDDFLLLGQSKKALVQDLDILLHLLQALGLQINESKSVLEPTQCIN